MGIQLKQAGLDEFIILEKAATLGGTWRENTYPGAECDIPSLLYQYSFEQDFPWESKWSGQAQILEYQIATANKYALMPHFEFSKTVTSCKYDEQNANAFHSANWDQNVELANKRVAVIGNAASAVQFVPIIAESVSHLTIFQRSANWMLPKHNRRYSKFEHWLWGRFPVAARLPRLLNWMLAEHILMPAIKGNRFLRWVLSTKCRISMRKWIKNPAMRAQLTPNYNLGAKRTLFSHEYYQALARENVELDVSGIEAFTSNGIRRHDGRIDDFDVVIYATGFKTNPFLMGLEVRGTNDQFLHEVWRDGAQAYLGMSTHGFPNLHIMYGPNTNLGHNSIILMIEAQANYIVEAIKLLDTNNQHSIEIKAEVEAAYNQDIQNRLSNMTFAEVENSWYKDGDKILKGIAYAHA